MQRSGERVRLGIQILIFSLFVGCFYHKGPALSEIEPVILTSQSGAVDHLETLTDDEVCLETNIVV